MNNNLEKQSNLVFAAVYEYDNLRGHYENSGLSLGWAELPAGTLVNCLIEEAIYSGIVISSEQDIIFVELLNTGLGLQGLTVGVHALKVLPVNEWQIRGELLGLN